MDNWEVNGANATSVYQGSVCHVHRACQMVCILVGMPANKRKKKAANLALI